MKGYIIVNHNEAEHKRQGRDESSLGNVVSCKFYNRQTHRLSAEAERELLANNNTLSASLSTGSVMVVAGPEMAAAGVWGSCRWGQWQRRWPTAGSSYLLYAHDQPNRARSKRAKS